MPRSNRSPTVRLLPALLLLLPSCFLSEASLNQPLDQQQVARIVPGTTTAQEVADLLGAPDRVVQLTDRSAWLYEHVREKQSALFLLVISFRGVDTQADRVWIFLDDQDVVSHLGSSLRAADAEFSLRPQ